MYNLKELNYVDPLYGLISRLNYLDWCKKTKENKNIAEVWYNPKNLRMLTFTRAGIDFAEQTAFKAFC